MYCITCDYSQFSFQYLPRLYNYIVLYVISGVSGYLAILELELAG